VHRFVLNRHDQGQNFIGHLGDFSDLQLMSTLSGMGMGLRAAGVPHTAGGAQAPLNYLFCAK
jgi:alanine-glyoxylate transaminase / serine-glyoxylate transaminase / serine-pyruvate transaminase